MAKEGSGDDTGRPARPDTTGQSANIAVTPKNLAARRQGRRDGLQGLLHDIYQVQQ